MSSYQPLADYLAGTKADIWEATFGEVEDKLGRPLPGSAYRHQAWWANQSGPGHSQTHGWRSVGWRTAKLDLERKRVRFERERARASSSSPIALAKASPEVDEDLVRRAMLMSNVDDRASVINAALADFIRRQAIRGVIAMGGSAPEFEAAPRERSWS